MDWSLLNCEQKQAFLLNYVRYWLQDEMVTDTGSSASLTHSTYDSPNLGYNTTNADSPALQQINPWFFDLWSQNDKHKHSLEVRAHDIWISPFPNTGMFPSLMLGSSYQPFRHNGKQLMWQLFVWLSWCVCWISWIKWVFFTYDIFNNRWASGEMGIKALFLHLLM